MNKKQALDSAPATVSAAAKCASNMPTKLAVLGSTGSIGTQTLDVVRLNPDAYEVVLLSAGSNKELLFEQIQEFQPQLVSVFDCEAAEEIAKRCPKQSILAGESACQKAVEETEASVVLCAIVGFAGLRPVLSAIRAGKNIALANKETIVAGGEIILAALSDSESKLVPVDSEHNALFQCLHGSKDVSGVRRAMITASGGPFLNCTSDELKIKGPEDAVKHPRWNMGAKISVDSATLMNKGLEVIEASVLFALEPAQIKVLVHPQSIIHALVEFEDGAALASMYEPDMKVPIAHALSYLRSESDIKGKMLSRLHSGASYLDLAGKGALQFFEPDSARFPALSLCYKALEQCDAAPAVLNAANEIAVARFLSKQLGFCDISEVVEKTLNAYGGERTKNMDELENLDSWARETASKFAADISF